MVALAQASGGTFTAFVLQLTQGFLVTIIAALLYGDMIAGEASRSTLKYLLTIPVPRLRLLAVKVAVASTLLLAGLVALTVVALVVGLISYGPGGIQVPGGPQLALGDSIARLGLATATGASGLLWAAGLGTLLTVMVNSPLAAAGGVVLVSILSRLLDSIPTLGDLRVVLPTHYSTAFQPVPHRPDRPGTGRRFCALRARVGRRAHNTCGLVVQPQRHLRLSLENPGHATGCSHAPF